MHVLPSRCGTVLEKTGLCPFRMDPAGRVVCAIVLGVGFTGDVFDVDVVENAGDLHYLWGVGGWERR